MHVHVVITANSMQWKQVAPVINRTRTGAIIIMTEAKSMKNDAWANVQGLILFPDIKGVYDVYKQQQMENNNWCRCLGLPVTSHNIIWCMHDFWSIVLNMSATVHNISAKSSIWCAHVYFLGGTCTTQRKCQSRTIIREQWTVIRDPGSCKLLVYSILSSKQYYSIYIY